MKEAEDAFADDRDLERLRKARLAELQAAAGRPKFGQARCALIGLPRFVRRC